MQGDFLLQPFSPALRDKEYRIFLTPDNIRAILATRWSEGTIENAREMKLIDELSEIQNNSLLVDQSCHHRWVARLMKQSELVQRQLNYGWIVRIDCFWDKIKNDFVLNELTTGMCTMLFVAWRSDACLTAMANHLLSQLGAGVFDKPDTTATNSSSNAAIANAATATATATNSSGTAGTAATSSADNTIASGSN
jgi:hypothetical protein